MTRGTKLIKKKIEMKDMENGKKAFEKKTQSHSYEEGKR